MVNKPSSASRVKLLKDLYDVFFFLISLATLLNKYCHYHNRMKPVDFCIRDLSRGNIADKFVAYSVNMQAKS